MNNGTDFAVFLYRENMDLPKEGTYYVVAGNGIWLHKDMPNFRGYVPVDNVSVLDDMELENHFVSKIPKLPAEHGHKIKQFFKAVVEKYHSEANVILYYNRTINDWKVHVPVQVVGYGHVGYRRTALKNIEGMEGYTPVGTIHSHADFNAFHSGTDDHDEESFDGIHITFGHNHLDKISISASFVINGVRFKKSPLDLMEGFEQDPSGFYSTKESADVSEQIGEWMKNITRG